MHRLTAKFLLLFALVGSLVPLALAVTAPPAHACCVRKAAHPCHGSTVAESDLLAIQSADCCNRDCLRGVTTAHWAHLRPQLAVLYLQSIHASAAAYRPDSPATASAEFQSTRGPPAC
jgi:hypothetical protein